MSRFRSVAARLSLAGIAAIALSAAVAVPASGHTGHLFTAVSPTDEVDGYFGTIDPVTAAVSPLPTALAVGFDGIEIVGETGYAIEMTNGEPRTFSLTTWDHTTGALLGTVPISLPVAGLITSVEGLDALPDGTLIAYVYANVEDGEFDVPQIWVASISPTTGLLTFLVDISDLDNEDLYTDSLATDPVTGVTYGFIDYNDGDPLVITLDLVGGTYTGPVVLTALRDEFGDGYVAGADYDTAGTLWFFYSPFGDGETAVLASAAGVIDDTTESVTVSADLTQDVSIQNLAYDPYVPQLAATGFPALAVGAVGLALLGAGGLAVIGRRRRTA